MRNPNAFPTGSSDHPKTKDTKAVPAQDIEAVDELSPEEVRKRLDEHYFGLADMIRAEGVEPNDLPEWKDAQAERAKILNALERHKKSKDPKEKKEVEEFLNRGLQRLVGKVSKQAGEGVTRLLAERARETPAIEAAALDEPLPNEGDENNVLHVDFASKRMEPTPPVVDAMGEEIRQEVKTNSSAESSIDDPHDTWNMDDFRGHSLDDPHDDWKIEDFTAYEATRKENKDKLRDLIQSHYGDAHSLEPDFSEDFSEPVSSDKKTPPVPSPSPSTPSVPNGVLIPAPLDLSQMVPRRLTDDPGVRPESMREQITPTAAELKKGSEHLPPLRTFWRFGKEKPTATGPAPAVSMGEQMKPTDAELKKEVKLVPPLSSFKRDGKEGRAKASVAPVASPEAKKGKKRSKKGAILGAAALIAAGVGIYEGAKHLKIGGDKSTEESEKGDPIEIMRDPVELAKQPSASALLNGSPLEYTVAPTISVSISQKGEGAIKLFNHLKTSLEEDGYVEGKVPQGSDMEYILTHSPDESSRHFDFLNEKGSRVMHLGDTFTIDSATGKFTSMKLPPGASRPPAFKIDKFAEASPVQSAQIEKAESVPGSAPADGYDVRSGYDEGSGVVEPTIVEPRATPVPNEVAPNPEARSNPTVEVSPAPAFENFGANDVLNRPETLTPLTEMDRTNLLDTIIKSGVGPRDEESVAEYMKRAIEHPAEGTIVDGYGGFKVNEGEAHIYGDTKGHLVVFGGDGRARLTVATEFLRTHPEADVYMNGKNEKDVMVAMPYQFVQGRLLMDTRPRSGIERLFNTNRAAKEITPKSLKAVIY